MGQFRTVHVSIWKRAGRRSCDLLGGKRRRPEGDVGSSSTINVLVNGTPQPPSTNSAGGTSPSWQQFTVDFVATSATTTIELDNADPSSDNSNLLDGVALR
ncbi:MAG TPA: hypothetical protein VGP07_05775 [Polyangia bacterium]